MADSEEDAWNAVKTLAKQALDWVESWLDPRMGAKNDQKLDNDARMRLLCIVRAVSWVESKHANYAGKVHGDIDPMQCGNPKDLFWRSVTGQLGNGDRYIRGPSFTGVEGAYWAPELGGRYDATLAVSARLTSLGDLTEQRQGHTNAKYTPALSYHWGVLYLVHRTNTHSGVTDGKTYKFGNVDWPRLVNGAEAYNGNGNPLYRDEIEKALKLSGCRP